jgi:hypothetical protein
MGIVTRNHPEAFISLLQDELWSQRLEVRAGRRRDGVCVRNRNNRRERRSIYTRGSDRSAHENGQLARDTAEKLLPVIRHTGSLNSQNPDSRNCTPRFDLNRQILGSICPAEFRETG